MDAGLCRQLEPFLRPLYQDLDGVSRFDEVERMARIACDLYDPVSNEDARAFELLLLFHRLGRWLEKFGNLSRVLLATGGVVSEVELRRTAASIRRLESPATDVERAVAAAVMIDAAGVRGLAERFANARREGKSIIGVAREALAEESVPEWMTERAREWLIERRRARQELCRKLLEEVDPRV